MMSLRQLNRFCGNFPCPQKRTGYSTKIPVHGATKSKYLASTLVLTLKNNTRENIYLITTAEPHAGDCYVHTIPLDI